MPVRTADDLIDALLARWPGRYILERSTGLPYGWAVWMRSLPPRADRSAALLAALPLRERRAATAGPPRALSWLQAFYRLWWQQWDPVPRDQRWMRWAAAACSALLHLLFAMLLLWAALVRLAPAPDAAASGERVDVEFISRGNPLPEGGGDPAAGAGEVRPQAAGDPGAAAASPAATAVPPPAPAAATSPAQESAAANASAQAAAEQPLQVTEVVEPSSEFVLPPPTPRMAEVRAPALRTPVPEVRERSVPLAEAAPTPAPVVPVRELQVPAPAREVVVREREVVIAQAPELRAPRRAGTHGQRAGAHARGGGAPARGRAGGRYPVGRARNRAQCRPCARCCR